MEKMMSKATIPASDEAWDDRSLGADENFVAVADDNINAIIDDAVGLQPISIRLQKSLIEDFKLIGELNGIGYQTLMRQVLKRFVDCEKKLLLREAAAAKAASKAAVKGTAKSRSQQEQGSKEKLAA